MPPDADIYGPWNADGSAAAPSSAVNSSFYSATTVFAQATPVAVTAGKITSGINLQTTTRASVPLYDGQVYSYFDNNTIEITPAPVLISTGGTVVAASIVGLGSNEPAAGLGVQIPGSAALIAPNGVVPYLDPANGYTYAYLYLNTPDLNTPGAQSGPQHMIFNTPDYMYVLPSAMYLTATGPPTVNAISSNGNGTFMVTGTNWSTGTLFYFDGLPASIQSINVTTGSVIVVPPPGASGQVSTLTAYNPDGQNSQFLQSASPVTFAYGNLPTPVITSITPSSLPAGAEAMIDITGSGFSFQQGSTTIGFGTSDIAVQRVFVLSPNHVQVDVSIAAGAALSNPDVSAISGFQVSTAPAGFQISPSVAGLPAPFPTLFNGLPGLTGSYAGATVSLYGSNLSIPGTLPTITIGGQPASILYASSSQINLVIPANLAPGPATLTLFNGIRNAFPVLVNIDIQPAVIDGIQNSTGAYIGPANPAHPGDLLTVTLTNFAPPEANINPSRVQVSLGGVIHEATQVTQTLFESVSYSQVTFQLSTSDLTGPAETLIVYLDGQSSYPVSIPVIAANAN
jgi:uncharacterized protein (TIGR03437 family)